MKKSKKKLITAILALGVTIGSFAFGTVAYFTDSATSSGNTISSATEMQVELKDYIRPAGSPIPVPSPTEIAILPGYTVEKSLSVSNTGRTPVWVRVALATEITLSEKEQGNENLIDYSLISFDFNTTEWEYKDGYYYYKARLAKGAETTPLYSAVHFSKDMGNLYKDSAISVTAIMQVVQANYNGETVFDAVGWVDGGNA
jgi:predicted ribosomally synthesized peptide with SipW-like signal peptide